MLWQASSGAMELDQGLRCIQGLFACAGDVFRISTAWQTGPEAARDGGLFQTQPKGWCSLTRACNPRAKVSSETRLGLRQVLLKKKMFSLSIFKVHQVYQSYSCSTNKHSNMRTKIFTKQKLIVIPMQVTKTFLKLLVDKRVVLEICYRRNQRLATRS